MLCEISYQETKEYILPIITFYSFFVSYVPCHYILVPHWRFYKIVAPSYVLFEYLIYRITFIININTISTITLIMVIVTIIIIAESLWLRVS